MTTGTRFSTPAPLASLRADIDTDRFSDGLKRFYPGTERPIERLRLLGEQAGRAYYAAADDLAAVLPSPPGPMMEAFAATLNGAIRFRASIADAVVRDRWIDGAYRAVETDKGVATPRILIDGLKGTNLARDGIRLRDAPGTIIRNFDLRHAPTENVGDELPEGIAIGKGTGILIKDGYVEGFRGAAPNGYPNGDGIATEGGTSGIIRRVTACNCSDGGFDIKGVWELDECRSEGCGKGFRFWHDITAGTLYTNRTIHILAGAKVRIRKLVAYGPKPFPLLTAEGDATVVVDAWDVSGMAPGWARVQANAGGNSITFGAGCV